jgi:hypothetical protein
MQLAWSDVTHASCSLRTTTRKLRTRLDRISKSDGGLLKGTHWPAAGIAPWGTPRATQGENGIMESDGRLAPDHVGPCPRHVFTTRPPTSCIPAFSVRWILVDSLLWYYQVWSFRHPFQEKKAWSFRLPQVQNNPEGDILRDEGFGILRTWAIGAVVCHSSTSAWS